MKAGAVFSLERKVAVVDLDEPEITRPGEVKLRMLEVGVCGTDREICSFRHGTPPDGADFLVLGHESLGEVVEAGPGVRTLRPGDLAVPMVRHACPDATCAACGAGRPDFCYTGGFRERGIKQLHGFMTDLVVEEERYVHRVPRELREVAVLIEPLTIAEKALIQLRAIRQRMPWGETGTRCAIAVVLGAGPVGLLGAMALADRGLQTYVYSLEPEESEKAGIVRSIGASYISSRMTPINQLAAKVGNIDLVYEAAGASQAAFDLLETLGMGGVYVLTGVPRHGEPVSVNTAKLAHNLVLKNQVVLGTVNAGRDAFEASIRDLAAFYGRWPDAVRSLITRRYPLERFMEPIFERSGIKNIIVLDGARA